VQRVDRDDDRVAALFPAALYPESNQCHPTRFTRFACLYDSQSTVDTITSDSFERCVEEERRGCSCGNSSTLIASELAAIPTPRAPRG
jgi:hypothetical protein